MQRDERAVVLWSYSLETMIPLCKEFEEKLIKHIWRTRSVASNGAAPSVVGSRISTAPSAAASTTALNFREKIAPPSETEVRVEEVETKPELNNTVSPPAPSAPPPKRQWWSWRLEACPAPPPASDVEKGAPAKPRKLVLIGPIYAGFGAGLAACECFSSLLSHGIHFLFWEKSAGFG